MGGRIGDGWMRARARYGWMGAGQGMDRWKRGQGWVDGMRTGDGWGGSTWDG